MKSTATWVSTRAGLQIHRSQLAAYGELGGVRDFGMLESALGRPINVWNDEQPTLCYLDAAYAFGLAMNHPFVPGNKRTAFVVSAVFLRLNGRRLIASEVDAATTFLGLAAGYITEVELALWFEQNSQMEPPKCSMG